MHEKLNGRVVASVVDEYDVYVIIYCAMPEGRGFFTAKIKHPFVHACIYISINIADIEQTRINVNYLVGSYHVTDHIKTFVPSVGRAI